MRKHILLLLFISSFIKADYLLIVKGKNNEGYATKCITYYDYSSKYLYYKLPNKPNTFYYYKLSAFDILDIKSGYYYDNSDFETCKKVTQHLSEFDQDVTLSLNQNNLSYLGLNDYDLNLMFAISGIIASTFFITAIIRFI